MSLKSGMGWNDPPGQTLSIKESIRQASEHFKATRRRWPNFVRVSPADANLLEGQVDGLLVIPDTAIGKSYRLFIGYSMEAKQS